MADRFGMSIKSVSTSQERFNMSENEFSIVRVAGFGISGLYSKGSIISLAEDCMNYLRFGEKEATRVAEWAMEKFPDSFVEAVHGLNTERLRSSGETQEVKGFIVRVGTDFYKMLMEPESPKFHRVNWFADATRLSRVEAFNCAKILAKKYDDVYVAHESAPFKKLRQEL